MLRQEILAGVLPAGAKLRQIEIAQRLGISQIPVREAIRQLEQEELVLNLPYKGAVVATLSSEGILEYFHLCGLVESETLAKALPFHTPVTLAHARTCLSAIVATQDPLEVYERMLLFLEALYRPSGRRVLMDLITRLYNRSQLYMVLRMEILARMAPGWMTS